MYTMVQNMSFVCLHDPLCCCNPAIVPLVGLIKYYFILFYFILCRIIHCKINSTQRTRNQAYSYYCCFPREAARNFLTALSLQRKSRSRQQSHQVMSGNIWAALRIALSMMDQPELFQAANIGDLDLLMRAFNLDVWGMGDSDNSISTLTYPSISTQQPIAQSAHIRMDWIWC